MSNEIAISGIVMIMKVLLISHELDLEGLVSAAIALVRYPQAKTVFLK